jgi:cell division protein FtsN
MSDQRGMGGMTDEDRLPWLEPVEEDDAERGVSAGRLLAGLVVMLAALGLIVGGVYWLKQRMTGGSATSGEPVTIAAQPGPIKVRPSEPGGLQVKGQGDSSYAASEGADPNARIDLTAVPEAPIAKPEKAPVAAPVAAAPDAAPSTQKPAPVWPMPAKPAPAPAPVAKAPAPAPVVAKPTPAPAKPLPAKSETATAPISGGAGQIQLGALDSPAKAEAVWKTMAGRYAYLGGLSHSVVKAEVNGKTYYRLRASGSGASAICAKLKVAGEACTVVG